MPNMPIQPALSSLSELSLVGLGPRFTREELTNILTQFMFRGIPVNTLVVNPAQFENLMKWGAPEPDLSIPASLDFGRMKIRIEIPLDVQTK